MANDCFNAWELDSTSDDEQLYDLYEKIENCIDEDNIDSKLIDSINNVLLYLKDLEKKEDYNKEEYIDKIEDFIFMLQQCSYLDVELISSEIIKQNIIEKLLICGNEDGTIASQIFDIMKNNQFMKSVLKNSIEKIVIFDANNTVLNNMLSFKNKTGNIQYNGHLAGQLFNIMYGYGNNSFLNDSTKADVIKKLSTFKDENGNLCTGKINWMYGTIPNTVTIDQLDSYLDKDTIEQYPIRIAINNSSELPIEILNKLQKKGANIESIQIINKQRLNVDGIDEENFKILDVYDMQTYIKCKKKIDEYIKAVGIEDLPQNIPNRDKVIFGRMCQLLSRITYDYSAISDSKEIYRKKRTSRNLVGGLLEDTCVCAGYAEIIRNIFSACNIPCNFICGFRDDKDEGVVGHAWNQIRLDGIWYNFDFTQVAGSIHKFLIRDKTGLWLGYIDTQRIDSFLLKSDIDFPTTKEYKTETSEIHDCLESITFAELITYLRGDMKEISCLPNRGNYSQSINSETVLDKLTSDVRSSEINESKQLFMQSISNKEFSQIENEGDRE